MRDVISLLMLTVGLALSPAVYAQGARVVLPTGADVIWQREPARAWHEALPVGNGRLGAMVYGGDTVERLQLNENNLYSGEPGMEMKSFSITRDFQHVRDLIGAGRYAAADTYINEHWLGRMQQSYQPMGELLHQLGAGDNSAPVDYRRWLDLADAVAGVRFVRDGVTYSREVFADRSHDAIVVRLHADRVGALNVRAAVPRCIQPPGSRLRERRWRCVARSLDSRRGGTSSRSRNAVRPREHLVREERHLGASPATAQGDRELIAEDRARREAAKARMKSAGR